MKRSCSFGTNSKVTIQKAGRKRWGELHWEILRRRASSGSGPGVRPRAGLPASPVAADTRIPPWASSLERCPWHRGLGSVLGSARARPGSSCPRTAGWQTLPSAGAGRHARAGSPRPATASSGPATSWPGMARAPAGTAGSGLAAQPAPEVGGTGPARRSSGRAPWEGYIRLATITQWVERTRRLNESSKQYRMMRSP